MNIKIPTDDSRSDSSMCMCILDVFNMRGLSAFQAGMELYRLYIIGLIKGDTRSLD